MELLFCFTLTDSGVTFYLLNNIPGFLHFISLSSPDLEKSWKRSEASGTWRFWVLLIQTSSGKAKGAQPWATPHQTLPEGFFTCRSFKPAFPTLRTTENPALRAVASRWHLRAELVTTQALSGAQQGRNSPWHICERNICSGSTFGSVSPVPCCTAALGNIKQADPHCGCRRDFIWAVSAFGTIHHQAGIHVNYSVLVIPSC